jgi:hypothetical protein
MGLRNTVDWMEFAGLTDEQVCIVTAELGLNDSAVA